jgi:uroporphyrinogen-III synthase
MRSPVVLNTRPREQAGELSRLLVDAGLTVVEAPAIASVPSWEPSELESVRRGLRGGAYAWVALASKNGARGLEPELRTVRVVCGASTATALGLSAEIALERFSAAAALEAIQSRLAPGDRVLVPRAAEGRDELIDGLRTMGVLVDAPLAYRTVPLEDASARLRAGGIDVLTLCSPSAVQSVTAAVPAGTLVACLGETTADAARASGLSVDAVALHTNMPALVAAVQAALAAQGVRV